jgi:RHS repeat-associated protein
LVAPTHRAPDGSTRALTNSSGTVVATYTYDPYGNLLGSTGSVSSPLGFGAAYTDVETGFLYLVNRYYDPLTGQFLTVDPMVDETNQPFGYTDGDPINEIDPEGSVPWWVWAVGAVIGTAIVAGAVACYLAEPCGLGASVVAADAAADPALADAGLVGDSDTGGSGYDGPATEDDPFNGWDAVKSAPTHRLDTAKRRTFDGSSGVWPPRDDRHLIRG